MWRNDVGDIIIIIIEVETDFFRAAVRISFTKIESQLPRIYIRYEIKNN